jgi:acetyl-CoA carboxylase biotin carboxyl carrier protein
MSLTFTDVEEILRIIDQFPVAEIRFEHGDLKLFIKRPQQGAAASMPASAQPVTAPAPQPAAEPQPATGPQTVSTAPARPRKQHQQHSEEIALKAPLMGVYYAAPAPDAEPFVKAGQQVEKGAVLCIIEVMKVMNLVKAPWSGVVVDIGAENGTMVELGQPLMWIQPQGEPA